MKRVSLRLEDDIHYKLKEHSFKNNISMNEIMLNALLNYFKEVEKDKENTEKD